MKERRKGLLWEMALILLTVGRLSVLYRCRKYFRGKGGLEQSAQCVPGIFPTAVLSYRAVFS